MHVIIIYVMQAKLRDNEIENVIIDAIFGGQLRCKCKIMSFSSCPMFASGPRVRQYPAPGDSLREKMKT